MALFTSRHCLVFSSGHNNEAWNLLLNLWCFTCQIRDISSGLERGRAVVLINGWWSWHGRFLHSVSATDCDPGQFLCRSQWPVFSTSFSPKLSLSVKQLIYTLELLERFKLYKFSWELVYHWKIDLKSPNTTPRTARQVEIQLYYFLS